MTYAVRVNVRDDSIYTLFSGWLGYDRIGNYHTVLVPAPIRGVALSYAQSGRRYVDIDSGLPSTCSELGEETIERDGTDIYVSIKNRVVTDPRADCAPLQRSNESFSLGLGTYFKPWVTYTVHVNDVTTTFGGKPGFETHWILAPIESVTVNAAESDPPQYFAEIVSGLPDSGCVLLDQVPIQRSGTDIYIFVYYRVPSYGDVTCSDAPPPPQLHSVGLGTEFEPGVTYNVHVNDFWIREGMEPAPGRVSTTFVAGPPH